MPPPFLEYIMLLQHSSSGLLVNKIRTPLTKRTPSTGCCFSMPCVAFSINAKNKCNFANNNPGKCEGLFTVNNICDDEESSREKNLSSSSAEMKTNPGGERTLRFSALERQHYLSLSQFKILTLCFRDRDTNESSEASHKSPRWNRGGPLSRSHFHPIPS